MSYTLFKTNCIIYFIVLLSLNLNAQTYVKEFDEGVEKFFLGIDIDNPINFINNSGYNFNLSNYSNSYQNTYKDRYSATIDNYPLIKNKASRISFIIYSEKSKLFEGIIELKYSLFFNFDNN